MIHPDTINLARPRKVADVTYALLTKFQDFCARENMATEGEQVMGAAAFFLLLVEQKKLDLEILSKAARLMRAADGSGYLPEFKAAREFIDNETTIGRKNLPLRERF